MWKLHNGIDFGVPCGTPVIAAADGTVISAGYGGGNGNRIVIDHGIVSGVGLASTYNHLSAFVVKSGKVKRGQLIAFSGTTGHSTGCHLHFETLENGQFVNPMKWLSTARPEPRDTADVNCAEGMPAGPGACHRGGDRARPADEWSQERSHEWLWSGEGGEAVDR